MNGAVVLDGSDVFVVVGLLTILSLSMGIITTLALFAKKRTEDTVEDVIDEKERVGEILGKSQINAIMSELADIKTQAAKIEFLRRNKSNSTASLTTASRIGWIRFEVRQSSIDTKVDGIITNIAELSAMMRVHLNWEGNDRRSPQS